MDYEEQQVKFDRKLRFSFGINEPDLSKATPTSQHSSLTPHLHSQDIAMAGVHGTVSNM